LVAVQAACSDGTALGPVGGSDGIAKGPYSNNEGFSWSTLTKASWHQNVVGFIISTYYAPSAAVGSWAYTEHGNKYNCPPGQVFVGITGKAVDSVRKLGFTCGWKTDMAAPQVQPAPFYLEDLR
jgi:hypothetical protein